LCGSRPLTAACGAAFAELRAPQLPNRKWARQWSASWETCGARSSRRLHMSHAHWSGIPKAAMGATSEDDSLKRSKRPVDYPDYQHAPIPRPNRVGFPLDRRVLLRTLVLRRHLHRSAKCQGRCTRRNSSGLFGGDHGLGRRCRECNGRVRICMPAGRGPQARALVQRQSRHETRRVMALTTESAHRRRSEVVRNTIPVSGRSPTAAHV
jgi:hypothetical protein